MSDSSRNLPEVMPVDADNQGRTFGVVIPCSTADFGDFVSSLLGEPQTILNSVEGAFVVDRDAIENIFNLVQQRVHQQNESSLVQWTITIVYDDQSSVKLASLNEFRSYAEVKSHISVGFVMHFAYLFEFTGRKTPEKQVLDISFNVGDRQAYFTLPRLMAFEPSFVIRIEHTARSWGVDLESLIAGHITTLRKIYQSSFRRFTVKYSNQIEPILALLFFPGAMAGLLLQTHARGVNSSKHISQMIEKNLDASQASNLLRLTVNQLASGVIQENLLISLMLVIIVGMASIITASYIENRLGKTIRGSLLLTKEAARKFETTQKSEGKLWLEVSVAVIAGSSAVY